MRFVAHGNHSRIGLRDSARFVFVFGDTVNDGSFFIFIPEFPWTINRTNDVDLVILPRFIFVINVNDVVSVVYPEDGVAGVPMNVMDIFHGKACLDQKHYENGINWELPEPLLIAGHFGFFMTSYSCCCRLRRIESFL